MHIRDDLLVRFKDALGASLVRLIQIFHEKFVKRLIFSQPSCIGKKDLRSNGSKQNSFTQNDIMGKVSSLSAKMIKRLGLIDLEREMDSRLSLKNSDALSKFILKVLAQIRIFY